MVVVAREGVWENLNSILIVTIMNCRLLRSFEAVFCVPCIGPDQSADVLRLPNEWPRRTVPRELHSNSKVPQHYESGEYSLVEYF